MIERLGLHWKHSEDELRIKLNQVIDELNNIEQRLPYRIMPRLDSTIKQLSSQLSKDYIVPKESAKKEEQSPPQEPYFVDGKVQKLVSDNIDELFAEIPPEKEEPNQLMREYRDQFPSIYRDIKDQAIVDYKKRLVDGLKKIELFRGINLDEAIKLVEDTD